MHKCIKHLTCGEMLCGICFAERMETEKLIAPKRPPVEMTVVHKKVQRKK